MDELPFLLANAGELEQLKETISDLNVFHRLVKTEDGKFDLMKSWQLVCLLPLKCLSYNLLLPTKFIPAVS